MQLTTGNGPLTTVSYGYDGMSRLASIGNAGLQTGSITASYTRLPGTNLLSTTSIANGSTNVMAVSRIYDNLNRLTNISSVSSVNSVLKSYSYNQADKRVKAADADGSAWQYSYNNKGEVISGVKRDSSGTPIPGMQFGYDYDDIGNRKSATVLCASVPLCLSAYSTNSLNQYTQRTVPSSFFITGSADESAKLAIQERNAGIPAGNAVSPDRLGKYFSKQYTVDNSSSAVSKEYTVYAAKKISGQDIVSHQSIDVFIPKTPEQFTYDPDGNLLSDGRFTYTWDGENRLSKVERSESLKVEFKYDYMGRRVEKKVYSWVSNDWQLDKTENFVYDGWNCIAIFESLGSSPLALSTSYLWGEDLSGSLQGAGGVGGLVAVTNSSGTYFPCYDGNGNITNYVNTSGASVASYEFDPFGRTISKSGSKADDFAYMFSTKPLDSESGLYNYGYRYYSADTGRWISKDPMGENGGRNLYATGNDLINRIDHLGLYSLFVTVNDNNEENPVNNVNDIYIKYKKSESPDLGHFTDDIRWSWIDLNKNENDPQKDTNNTPLLACDFKFQLQIDVGSDESIKLKSGSECFYVPHAKGNDGRAFGWSRDKDSTIAHERGHAQAYWEKVRTCARSFYYKIMGLPKSKEKRFNHEEREKIRVDYKKTCYTDDYWTLSGEYANKWTRNYFDNAKSKYIRTFPVLKEEFGRTIPKSLNGTPYDASDIWMVK